MEICDCLDEYTDSLCRGDRASCLKVVCDLLEAEVDIQLLYVDLFGASLCQVGEWWEINAISITTAQLATAITESLINQAVAPKLFGHIQLGRTIVVACVTNELHHIGGRMVADIAEMNGWDAHFVGANAPVSALLKMIREKRPDVLALSVAVIVSLPSLKNVLESVRACFPHLPIWIGGQMFSWGGKDVAKKYSGVKLVLTLPELENELKEFASKQPLIDRSEELVPESTEDDSSLEEKNVSPVERMEMDGSECLDISEMDLQRQLVSLNNELSQVMRELHKTNARLRLQSSALDAAANAIVITSASGVIEWANAAFTTFTGYSVAEAIGKNTSLLRSGAHDQAFYRNLWETGLSGEVWRGEMINRRKDGSLYPEEMTITPIRESNGEITHFVAVKQDITERKRAEAERLQFQAQLRHAQKMALTNRTQL